MAPDERTVVWILGAGFSRPLNGPLLAQLLSPASFRDLERRFKKNDPVVSWAARYAASVFHYGTQFQDGGLLAGVARNKGEPLWTDAEDYLDRLDAAASRPSDPGRIQRVLQELAKRARTKSGRQRKPETVPELCELRDAARRLIAAECSLFVEDGGPSTERWSAHADWARTLDNRHTLATFNYDLVLETLGKHLATSSECRVRPLLPGMDRHAQEFEGLAPIVKLHGSVDWRQTTRNGNVVFARQDDTLFAVHAPADECVIATPGPTKARTTKALAALWNEVTQAIRGADAVVFVGYRFPESDAFARKTLLGALEQVSPEIKTLHVHTVLGPGNADASRLGALVRATMQRGRRTDEGAVASPGTRGRYRLVEHPLYSQDFFSTYKKELLFNPF